jgi:hypothetical protein
VIGCCLYLILYVGGEDTILEFAHQLVGLLRQAERQDGVGQDSSQMGEESFVDSQDTLGLDGLCETIEDSFVKVAVLVVHARHDGI